MQPKPTPTNEKKKGDSEKDVGFGKSHGYGESHGGPSGPGDAPAKPLPKTRPETPPAKKRTDARVSDAFRLECRDSQRNSGDLGGLRAR